VFRQHGGSTPVYIVAGAIVAVLAVLAWTGDVAAERRRAAVEADAEPGAGTAGAGGIAGAAAEGTGGVAVPAASARRSFPIPPMDLPHYHGVGVTVPAGERPPPSGGSGDPGSTVNGTSKEVSGVCPPQPRQGVRRDLPADVPEGRYRPVPRGGKAHRSPLP